MLLLLSPPSPSTSSNNMHPSKTHKHHADGCRIVKHRASQACGCCRTRKVRCDLVSIGSPCTNCRLDNVECVVAENNRRRRGPRATPNDLTPSRSSGSSAEGDENDPSHPSRSPCQASDFPMFDNIPTLPLPDMKRTSPVADGASSSSHSEEEQEAHQPHAIYQRQESRCSWEDENRLLHSQNRDSRPQPSPPSQNSWQYSSELLSKRERISLPQYLKAAPSNFTDEDLEYLQMKGAFVVPEADLCNALLSCYTQHVHPYMPVIDLLDFLNAIWENQAEKTVSLLLFQAVMFTAVAYIDMRFLRANGYVSRRSARRAYYQRVKLLYDLDYEFDRVTCLQAVLLMTYWHENPDEPKDAGHWLAIAVSLCRTIGLNCDTSSNPAFSVEKRRLWKRIWWSCYVRDRLVAIALRRPTQISPGDFDVPMLELSDFETIPMPGNVVDLIGESSAIKDSSTRLELAAMCIELARLCVCTSEVITIQYPAASDKSTGPQNITQISSARRDSPADPADIIRCDRQLEQWRKELPPTLQFPLSEAQTQTEGTASGCKITYIHQAILKGIYFTAMSALHRPQSLLLSSKDHLIAAELREFSIRKIRESADHIVDIYNDLRIQDLIRYLPNTGVTCLVPAIIVYLGDIKSSHPNICQSGLRNTQVCREALQALQDMYASAELARASLESTLRRTKFTVSPSTTLSDPRYGPRPPQTAIQATVQQAGFMLPSPPWSGHTAPMASFNSCQGLQEGEALVTSLPLESERTMNDSPDSHVVNINLHNSESEENQQIWYQSENHESLIQESNPIKEWADLWWF